jgi:hypothetical protein
LRLAQQAEETGRDTLARLGAQGERIHNTERNLDLGKLFELSHPRPLNAEKLQDRLLCCMMLYCFLMHWLNICTKLIHSCSVLPEPHCRRKGSRTQDTQ